jgi:cobalt-zinc-cadmium efflux system outer membrane protein
MYLKFELICRVPICVLVVGLLAGCASQRGVSMVPEPRPLGAAYRTIGPDSVGEIGFVEPVPERLAGPVDLNQALSLSLLHNPELEAFSLDVRASEARLLQASVFSNPELELELEEYDRGGLGFDSAETSISLGQLFELGGKRRLRKQMAEAEGNLAGWDYERVRLEVFAETARRFIAAEAAQRRLELAESAVALGEEMSRAVEARVKAGKEPPLQEKKAAGELELSRLTVVDAQNDVKAAQSGLVSMWGVSQVSFQLLEGDLDKIHSSVPSLQVVRSHVQQNPELARLDAERRLREIALAAEKAARIPDLEAFVGYQQSEENNTDSIKFGIAVPLPVFDRNQGGIAAAGNELARSGSERRSIHASLAVEADATHARLRAALSKVTALRRKILPTMNAAFSAAQEGYRQGKFGYMDVLDAQRSLIHAEQSLLDALTEYHTAVIELESVTATGIENLINASTED